MNDLNPTDSTPQDDRRPIPGYEGRYEVDQQGNIYAMFPFKGQPAGRKKNFYLDSAGYVFVSLSKNNTDKRYSVHRLVMLAWRPIENSASLDVNHIDGNKQNNTLANLEWLTHHQNSLHARFVLNAWKNRLGERVGGVKLTADKIREIRRLRATGMTQESIAAIFNVTQENIGKILRGKTWSHVK